MLEETLATIFPHSLIVLAAVQAANSTCRSPRLLIAHTQCLRDLIIDLRLDVSCTAFTEMMAAVATAIRDPTQNLPATFFLRTLDASNHSTKVLFILHQLGTTITPCMTFTSTTVVSFLLARGLHTASPVLPLASRNADHRRLTGSSYFQMSQTRFIMPPQRCLANLKTAIGSMHNSNHWKPKHADKGTIVTQLR